MRSVAVIALLFALTRSAVADDSREELSPGTAVALSLVPTLGGLALTAWGSTLQATGNLEEITVGTGLVIANIGPTLGNIYAHDVWNPGLATRVVGVGVAVVGVGLLRKSKCVIECGRGDPRVRDAGWTVLGLAGVTYAAGAAIEIWNAYSAAANHNTRLAANRSSFTLVPLVRSEGAGLSVAGAF